MIKNFIYYLLIFIIGGLIVSFIINPSSFYSVKDRLSEKINFVGTSSKNTLEVSSYQICMSGEFNRVICKGICSFERMDYRNYKCINGKVVCNCRRWINTN